MLRPSKTASSWDHTSGGESGGVCRGQSTVATIPISHVDRYDAEHRGLSKQCSTTMGRLSQQPQWSTVWLVDSLLGQSRHAALVSTVTYAQASTSWIVAL